MAMSSSNRRQKQKNMSEANTRWGILYCPRKGFRTNGNHWEKVQQALEAKGVLYDMVQSESSSSVERLVDMLIRNGYTTIVIVGGDSALNDAVNCLMNVEKQVRDRVALGVIPNGVLNDFARFWGYEEDEEAQVVEWLTKRRVRKIDLGSISYTNKDGNSCHRYFLNCINIGMIADIMNVRQQARKLFGSRKLAFLSSLLLMTFRRHEYKMNIKINGEELDRKIMTVCVGNGPGYGQTPNAVPYSGMLDVSVVYNPKVKQLFNGLWLLVTGRFLNHRSVHPYRTRRMVVEAQDKALVGVDGRLQETSAGAYSIQVEPEMVNFLIPD